MKICILPVLCAFLVGCPAIIQGLVKNESDIDVYYLTDWKPFEEPIPPGKSREIRLEFPGACIELIVAGKSRYFEVPIPPDGSEVRGYWYATYSVSFSNNGLYYRTKNGKHVQFKEVDQCST